MNIKWSSVLNYIKVPRSLSSGYEKREHLRIICIIEYFPCSLSHKNQVRNMVKLQLVKQSVNPKLSLVKSGIQFKFDL